MVLGLSSKPRPIHITTLQIPVVYDSVLQIVPGLHARPAVLSEHLDTPTETSLGPPEGGYDLIVHVGVGLPGNLEVEKQAHKLGYTLADCDGKLPSIAAKSKRGFSGGCYDGLQEELKTEIDVDGLVSVLKNKFNKVRSRDLAAALVTDSLIQPVKASEDPGRFICDFTYYSSLANAQQADPLYTVTPRERRTQVLFIHCSPVGDPLETPDVTELLKEAVTWICHQLQLGDDQASG